MRRRMMRFFHLVLELRDLFEFELFDSEGDVRERIWVRTRILVGL